MLRTHQPLALSLCALQFGAFIGAMAIVYSDPGASILGANPNNIVYLLLFVLALFTMSALRQETRGSKLWSADLSKATPPAAPASSPKAGGIDASRTYGVVQFGDTCWLNADAEPAPTSSK